MLRLIMTYAQYRDFLKREDGATAIEYGLIAAGIAVVLIGAITLVGGDLTSMFESISTGLGGSGAVAD